MRARRLAPLLLAVLAPCAAPLPAQAGEDAAAEVARERAEAQAAALRGRLLVPRTPWGLTAELVLDGYRIGEVVVRAEPTSVQGRPAWRVLERTLREGGAARMLSELTFDLAPDLTLLGGESLHEGPGGRGVTTFRREGAEMRCRRVGRPGEDVRHPVPGNASLGLFATLMLSAAMPDEAGATCRLPVFDPRHAYGDDDGRPLPRDLDDLTLTTTGRRAGPDGRSRLGVRVATAYGRSLTLYLAPDTRGLLEVEGGLPRWSLVSGSRAFAPPWFVRVNQPPQGPLDAFVAFGRGYHTARRDLLESVFHWPTMHAREMAAGSYPEGTTLEAVREDWIRELLAQSKRRTTADCDDLLLQLLGASQVERQPDGRTKISTPPAFGGHSYLLGEQDGRWWIMQVD